MKKYLISLFIVISLFLFFAWTAEVKYDLTPIEYVKYSIPLNESEKQYLRDKEGLIFGADKSAPPISYTNKKTGQNEGLVIDYMSSLSIELGTNVTYKPLVWNEIIDSLDSGRIDMSDLFESDRRREHFDFSQSLYELRGIIISRENRKDLNRIEDINGKVVAVIKDDYCEELLKERYENTDTKFFYVNDVEEAMDNLLKGNVDVVAGDEIVINYYIKNSEKDISIKYLDVELYKKSVTLAVTKGKSELLTILNKGILSLKKKNILIQTQEKWFGNPSIDVVDVTSYRWIIIAVMVIILSGFLIYFWDAILRRIIAEKTRELEIQKEKLRTIIDTIHLYIIVIDEQNRVVVYNKMCSDVVEEKQNILTVDSIYDINPFGKIFQEYEKHPSNTTLLEKFENKYYNVDVRDLNELDKTRLLLFEDVTHKILAEKKLRQESKMVAVGQLSSGLAHEIRNPLGLIKTYKYIIKKYVTDDVSAHAVDVIDNSVDRINGIIENLLDFARLGGEKVSFVSINKIINNILLLEEKKAKKDGISIDIDCPEDLFFYTNEESINMILFNLVSNGVEALREEITKSEKKVSIKVNVNTDKLLVTISDNGPGIPEEIIENIYNPFFTTRETGTGLGLYIVSVEVDKIDGTISIDSKLGVGTKFHLVIPKSDKEANDELQ